MTIELLAMFGGQPPEDASDTATAERASQADSIDEERESKSEHDHDAHEHGHLGHERTATK